MGDLEDEVRREAQKLIDDLKAKGLSIPDNATEDEAVRAIKQQLEDAGLSLTDDDARELYQQHVDEQG